MLVCGRKQLNYWSPALAVLVLSMVNAVGNDAAALTKDKETSITSDQRFPTKLELEHLLESLMRVENKSFDGDYLNHAFQRKLDGPFDIYDAYHKKRGISSGFHNNILYIYFEEYDPVDVDSNDNWLVFGWAQDVHASEGAVMVFPSAPDGSCVGIQDLDLLTSRSGWVEVTSSNMPEVPRHRNYIRTAKEFMSIWMDESSRCFGKIEIVHGAHTVKLLKDNR